MSVIISPAGRARRLQSIADSIAGGTLIYYSGTRPAFGTLTGLTEQARVTLDNPCAQVSTTPSVAMSFLTTVEAIRSDGQPITWARFLEANGDIYADVDVGTTSAGVGDILLDNTSGTIGGFVQITGGSVGG